MQTLDDNILLLINGANHPALDILMSLISGKLIWLPLYLLLLFAFWRKFRFSWQLLAALATIGVTFFLTDFCCSHLIRPLFSRLRPVCVENPIHTMVYAVEGYRHNSYGFPSCHASNTFGLATLVWLFLRNRWATFGMFFWATAVCYSRVYLAVHYPGDILAGALLGFFIALAVYSIAIKLMPFHLRLPHFGGRKFGGFRRNA